MLISASKTLVKQLKKFY